MTKSIDAGKTEALTPKKPPRSTRAKSGSGAGQADPTEPVLLSGGNPQIPKGGDDAPVEAYLAAMPGWKQDVGRKLDAIIVATVPGVRKAVKWNTPFYSMDGTRWFLGFHCLTKYVKVAFPDGAALVPPAPGQSKQANVRYLDIFENKPFDEAQFADWVRQASQLPGEKL